MSTEASKERLNQFENLYHEILKDLTTLEQLQEHLKQTQAKMEEMSQYYAKDWMEDYDQFPDLMGYHILNEDAIYNAFYEYEEKKKALFRYIANHI